MPLSPTVALTSQTTLPELRAAEAGMRAQATREGITYDIADFGGLRTQSDTTTILGYRAREYATYVAQQKAKGLKPVDIDTFRPIAPFGLSYHNYGAAFDVLIIGAPPGMSFAQALIHLSAMAPTYGLRWGGLFPKPDAPHFELAQPLAVVEAKWKAYTSPPSLPDTSSLPGPSIIAPGVTPLTLPRVSAAVARLPLPAGAKAAAIRHPFVTASVSTGALVVAGLLVYLAVQRFID